MPGILPMKVIKVGTNAQTRIAQACDRCRSKKIRCDGIRPCCSQCSNVGFECKTSDKLSRRAFPRGYTESLEERVRGLESEVRELKDLLDEKDEKIDLLSRIHSQSSHPIQLSSPRRPSAISATSSKSPTTEPAEKDEVFKVQQSPYLLDANGSDSYFAGTSSTRTFVEAFKHKVQECGRSTDDIDTELLLAGNATSSPADSPMSPGNASVFSPPPRIVSDQLINVFFQEWAPLFPVLHRPLFLTLYERYCSEPEDVTDKAELAQLNLVFAIAAVSSSSKTVAELKSFEQQWKAAMDEILTESSMSTLQSLILAQIYCVQQGDLTRLLTYKGLSTSLSARFGLHQSQKRFALGTLTCETRKKVFWTLYTLDCFTAVVLGLPKQLKDDDVNCEYPVDADDEYVTERGFQPTLPGESTKLSSALALFRAARILSKVLEDVFPAKTSYELSMKKLTDLQDELDAWHTSLAPHLRLQFAQDKPSTGTISSRSPLLSLTYHYIRALINRPVICASVGGQSSSSMMTHASSCKHIIQILQLLGERGMSFSYCLNRNELLVLCGFGLLSQGLGLDQSSKILRDNQKMLRITIGMLEKGRAPCAQEFSRVANTFLPTSDSPTTRVTVSPPKANVPQMSRHNSDSTLPITINPHPSLPASTRKQLKAIASRFTSNTKTPKLDASTDHRRATIPHIGLVHDAKRSRESGTNVASSSTHGYSPASVSRSEPARSPLNSYRRSPANRPSAPPAPGRPMNKTSPSTKALNLDYLSFGPDSDATPVSRHKSSSSAKSMPQPTDWEKLLGSLDNGATNIYDACYGGQPVEALLDSPAARTAHSTASKSPVAGNSTDDALSGDPDLWAQLYHTDTNTTLDSALTLSSGGQAESVLSLSSAEDLCGGRSSGEDFVVDSEWLSIASAGLEHKTSTATLSGSVGSFRGIVMPATVDGDDGLSFGSPWESGLTL